MTWEKEEKTMKHRIKILLLAVLIAALCNCMLMIGMTKKKENNTIPKDASLICEETEKSLVGGVSKHPKLSSYGDKTLFYDFTELLNNREELSQHPITESVTMTKRNKDLVTAFVEREETTFTISGQIKEKDAGYIKLGDTRYSTLNGYANLIGKGEKLNEYNISSQQFQ